MEIITDLTDFLPEISTQLPNWYSIKAKRQAEKILREWINDNSPKRVNVEWITIDDISSLDLDDWIWAEKRRDWWYTVFISIADPTEAIDPLSAIDLEAINKATSFYTSTHTIHMLPIALSTDLISLNDKTTRLSKTIQIDYDSEMNVNKTNIYESKFYNKKRFNYSTFWQHFQYEWKEFHSELNLMWEIARKLRDKRKNKANFNFNESDRKIQNNFENKTNNKHIASILIEEFMVAANIEVARFLIKNQISWIFRAHMPESKWRFLEWSEMERAYYTTQSQFHYWLWEDKYLHTTSPMRRLADYMLDRFLKAHIRWDKEPYSIKELSELVKYINMQVNSIVLLEREHNFQSKIISKSRKSLNKWKDLNLSEIKEHIRHWVWRWLKLPQKIKEQIIDKIKNWEWKDWYWIITPYMVSRETEIIEILKEKTLNNMPIKTFLNIITKNIVERKQSSVFKVVEKRKKKAKSNNQHIWGKKQYNSTNNNSSQYSIDIYFKEEKILTNKWDSYNENEIKRKMIVNIFDYFIKRSKS